MITSTMTADEVLKVFDQDYDRIRAYLHHKQKAIRRELLKNRRESTMRCYDYSTNNADYTLNVFINKKGDAYVNTFAPGTEPLSVQLAKSIYSQFYDSKQ